MNSHPKTYNGHSFTQNIPALKKSTIPFHLVTRTICNYAHTHRIQTLTFECALSDVHALDQSLMDAYADISALSPHDILASTRYIPSLNKHRERIDNSFFVQCINTQNKSLTSSLRIIIEHGRSQVEKYESPYENSVEITTIPLWLHNHNKTNHIYRSRTKWQTILIC